MGISGQDLIVNLSMVFWPFFSRICLLLGEFEGRLGFLKQRWPYYLGFPGSSDSKEFSCSAGNTGSIPGSGRSPGEGNGNPLQYSCCHLPPTPPRKKKSGSKKYLAFLGGSDGKASVYTVGDPGLIPELGRSPGV